MSRIGKKISWYWLVLTAVITAVVAVMATYVPLSVHYRAELAEVYEASDIDDQTYAYVKKLFETYYIGELGEFDEDTATESLIAAYVASTGDKYARYMNPEAYQQYIANMSGTGVGIGVSLSYNPLSSELEIVMVMPNSPAEEAGLETGDLIVAAEDFTIAEDGYTAVTDAIRGEEGSEVTITVKRGEEQFEKTLIRASVEAVSALGSMASDGKTGVIRILKFNTNTPQQFISAVESLEAQGAERFVFDLRDNTGGELESVLSILGYILPKDSTLIRIIDAGGEVTTRQATDEHTLDCPMAVLINGYTASAAELFTSCLRDYNKVEIVGVKSYGKGCMQRLFQLPNGGCVTITFRMYSPPIGDNYDGIGITPDYTVELSEEAASMSILKLTEENDDQLKAALNLLAGN